MKNRASTATVIMQRTAFDDKTKINFESSIVVNAQLFPFLPTEMKERIACGLALKQSEILENIEEMDRSVQRGGDVDNPVAPDVVLCGENGDYLLCAYCSRGQLQIVEGRDLKDKFLTFRTYFTRGKEHYYESWDDVGKIMTRRYEETSICSIIYDPLQSQPLYILDNKQLSPSEYTIYLSEMSKLIIERVPAVIASIITEYSSF